MGVNGRDVWRPARVRPGRRLAAWLGLSFLLLGSLLWARPVWALYLSLAYLAPFAFLALFGALLAPFALLSARYGAWREQEERWWRAERERRRAMDQMLEEKQAQLEIESELKELASWDGYVPRDLLAGGDKPIAS